MFLPALSLSSHFVAKEVETQRGSMPIAAWWAQMFRADAVVSFLGFQDWPQYKSLDVQD